MNTKKIFKTISCGMYFWNKAIRLLLILFTVGCLNAKAQQVTFKVNLSPQLKDSVYIPGRDHIYVKGDIYPLTNSNNKVYLQIAAPADSIFKAKVNFSSTTRGQLLHYTYVIVTPDREITEHMPRVLKLSSRDQELDALYFDSFAW